MRKILCLFFVLCILILSLAACNNKNEESVDTDVLTTKQSDSSVDTETVSSDVIVFSKVHDIVEASGLKDLSGMTVLDGQFKMGDDITAKALIGDKAITYSFSDDAPLFKGYDDLMARIDKDSKAGYPTKLLCKDEDDDFGGFKYFEISVSEKSLRESLSDGTWCLTDEHPDIYKAFDVKQEAETSNKNEDALTAIVDKFGKPTHMYCFDKSYAEEYKMGVKFTKTSNPDDYMRVYIYQLVWQTDNNLICLTLTETDTLQNDGTVYRDMDASSDIVLSFFPKESIQYIKDFTTQIY